MEVRYMGLIKKLFVGFLVLLILGVAGIFGMQYYYNTAYTKVPIEVKTQTVSGEVFYLSHTLEPGTYKIEAGGTGVVKAIKILDPDTNEVVSSLRGQHEHDLRVGEALRGQSRLRAAKPRRELHRKGEHISAGKEVRWAK
jgi:hypothetical protein